MPNVKRPSRRTWIGGILITLLLAVGVTVSVILLRFSSQDIRQQADEGNGVADVVFVVPSLPSAGQEVNIPLVIKQLDGSAIEGIQVVATITFSANVPSDLAFIPTTLTGLKTVGTPFQVTQSGGTLLLALIPDSSETVISPTGDLELGVLRFTAPTQAEVIAVFDEGKTKILQRVTGSEMVKGVSTAELSFTTSTLTTGGSSTTTIVPPSQVPPGDIFPDDEYELEPDVITTGTGLTSSTLASTTNANNDLGRGGLSSSSSATRTRTQVLVPSTASASSTAAFPTELPVSGSSDVLILGMLGILLLVIGGGWSLLQYRHQLTIRESR